MSKKIRSKFSGIISLSKKKSAHTQSIHSFQSLSAHTLYRMKFITTAIKLNRFKIIAANYSVRLTDTPAAAAVVGVFFST